MSKKVYVCEEERLDSAGKELVKVCEELEQAREWQRESFLKFKGDHAEAPAYQDNARYHWEDGVYEGKNAWECWFEYEHIGWYITEMELEGVSKE